jgi:plastocyanin
MRHSTTKMRRRALALVAVGLLLPLGACGDDDDDDAGGSETTEATDAATDATDAPDDTGVPGGAGAGLVIEDFTFGEASATAGGTLAVTNADGAPHTVTSDDDAWDELRVEGGTEGELTVPSEAGEYAFHCEIHPTMTGTLVVE